MLWPIVLPFQLTVLLLAVTILLGTLVAPFFRLRRATVFGTLFFIALLAFLPAIYAIGTIVDRYRFGIFTYTNYRDVRDFRVERYLPPTATQITIEKTAMGHRARYTITEKQLRDYVNDCWNAYGNKSAVGRAELGDCELVDYEHVSHWFKGLDWPPLTRVRQFHSTVQGDGGGAQYYFDDTTGTVYQYAGYW